LAGTCRVSDYTAVLRRSEPKVNKETSLEVSPPRTPVELRMRAARWGENPSTGGNPTARGGACQQTNPNEPRECLRVVYEVHQDLADQPRELSAHRYVRALREQVSERCSMPHHRHASAIFDTVRHSLPENRSCICRICSLALRDGIAGRLRNTAYFEIGNGQWLELWGAPTKRVLWTLRIWQRMCFEEGISEKGAETNGVASQAVGSHEERPGS